MQLLAYKNVRGTASEIWKIRGIRGFYSGYLPLLLREIPFSFINMPIIEYCQNYFNQFERHFCLDFNILLIVCANLKKKHILNH